MHAAMPRYSKEETARRGQERYREEVQPLVEAAHKGEFAAIDIDTGAYELDTDDYAATERLLARLPKAQIWLVRVGHVAAYRVGGPRLGTGHEAT